MHTSYGSNRSGAFLGVIVLHVILVYGFYTGLAAKLIQVAIPPLEIKQYDKLKDSDRPPPPLPKLEPIKPYVPPPEFVDMQRPPDDNAMITPPTPNNDPAPAVVVPTPKQGTPVRQDPKHPLKIGVDFYPDASKRGNEEGRCMVLLTVFADGHIGNESIQNSSGFPRLDEACLKGVHGQHMLPATEEGRSIEKTVVIPIVWKLTK